MDVNSAHSPADHHAGFSFDWDRELSTTSPQYYKWTQWIFLQLFNKGLAYQAKVPVNWCPALGTVLANEEIIDGKSERGSHPVERLPMRQVSPGSGIASHMHALPVHACNAMNEVCQNTA